MNDYNRVKSWTVKGSKDGSKFEIIDQKVDSTAFQFNNGLYSDPNNQKNFQVIPNNQYYRYIRITSIGKNWYDTDYFILHRVEFFGFVQYD